MNTDSITIDTSKIEIKPHKRNLFKGISNFFSKLVENDSNYIEPNHFLTTVMWNNSWNYNIYKISAKDDLGNKQSITLAPDHSFKVGPYFGYSILFLGLTANISAQQNTEGHTNINASIYAPFMGMDIYYENGKNNYYIQSLSGFPTDVIHKVEGLPFLGLNFHSWNYHFYYIFNKRKFSYTAAYSQSTQQKRSAGSFILGLDLMHQNIKFDFESFPSDMLFDSGGNPIMIDNLKVQQINYNYYSVSFGYSHNWLFTKNMLLNYTINPTVGLRVNKGETVSFNKNFFKDRNFCVDMISRLALVWNTGRWYAGTSAIVNTYSYEKENFSILQAYFRAEAYIGFNLWKKKAYKKGKKSWFQF